MATHLVRPLSDLLPSTTSSSINAMSASYDLETQMPTAPATAAFHNSTRASIASSASSDITVFGTHDSRHSASNRPVSEVLPPYFEAPPAYTERGSSEPATLAMYLFKLGFCEYLISDFFDLLLTVYAQCSHHSGS